MTPKAKARALSAVGVCLGLSSTTFSIVDSHCWLFVASNVFFFGATCATAGVTWWVTRGK